MERPQLTVLTVHTKAVKRAKKLRGLWLSGDRAQFVWYLVSCLPFVGLIWTIAICCLHVADAGGLLATPRDTAATRSIIFSAAHLLGQVVGKEINRALKLWFNQPRPSSSGKTSSSGMPSYHAQAIAFLCSAPLLEVTGGALGTFPGADGGVTTMLAVTLAVSYSRIALGKHTWPQVAVGMVVGVIEALLFMTATGHLVIAVLE